ncbi:putative ferric-chelate reductase 1 [Patella vulgata]|uniref:putative ferric-chelate reductase 1 n=1 Tax=Patella vulgata TaxID=6465 RepID=UPI0024A7FB64|nr:putative ferric-chelate reductase 1 [Patella vulgata]
MTFAWMFCASIGIVISRFYKPIWPSAMICGRKVWYTISVLNIDKLHPVLGIIVTFLTIVNICMGTCRPGYDSKHRPIFNWAHWCVGILDHMIAGNYIKTKSPMQVLPLIRIKNKSPISRL